MIGLVIGLVIELVIELVILLIYKNDIKTIHGGVSIWLPYILRI